MASVPIPNAPKFLTMSNFKGVSSEDGGLAKACKYMVVIKPRGENFLAQYRAVMGDLPYLCEVAEIPGRGFMNIDVRYYGPNQKLPFLTQYEDINLTFLCRNKSREREFFDDWMSTINPTNTFDFNYRDTYEATIDIYQYDVRSSDPNAKAPDPTYWITIHNAYPVLLNPQPMAWPDEQFQRVVVTFTYKYWNRVGLDPEQRTDADYGYSYGLVPNVSPSGRNISISRDPPTLRPINGE